MADVHNFISEALKEGHPIEDIVGFLGSSDNPEEKAWAQKWQATAAQPAYEAGASQTQPSAQPNTSMLEDFSNLSTPAKLATGAGVLAGTSLLGAGAYAGKKAIDVAADVRREKALSGIEPSAAVKVQQGDLALRQAQFEASRQGAATGETILSPVEQIKLEREKLKLEADRQKLAREAELHTQKITQMARQQEISEAKATAAKQAAAAKQQVTASGSISQAQTEVGKAPKDIGLVDRGIQNTILNEADAAVKKAAVAPIQANAPVAPPSLVKGPEIQLTPATSLVNEPVTPVAKSAPVGTSPVEGGVAIPEGMHPQYKPNPKKGIMGPSAFNHLANNLGLEKAIEVWEGRYGKTNVPYKEFMAEYEKAAGKQMQGPVKPLPEGSKPGGSFGKPELIPEYIRGSASLKGMASLAATAGLLGIAGSQKSQEAMERASKAIKDIGISPDIFAGKGEEIGRLGNAYVSAGNPSYQRELLQKIESTNDPEYKKLLQTELQKIGYSGGGRGIAPPSAYQR